MPAANLSACATPWLDLTLGAQSGICAVCGAEGDTHLLVDKVLDKSTGKITELLPIGSGVICPCCAAVWQEPKVWHRSLFISRDRLAMPLIALAGTIKKEVVANPRKRSPLQDHKDRPVWHELLRDESWWEQERIAVLTTDGQRRVWHKARASRGIDLAIVCHDLDRAISEVVTVNLPRLKTVLGLVELVYSQDYSKIAIEHGLLLNAKNIRQAVEFEKQLREWRGTAEFLIAVIVAQRQEALKIATDTQPTIPKGGSRALAQVGANGQALPSTQPDTATAARRKSDGGDRQLPLFG